MTIIAQPKYDTYQFDALRALDGFSESMRKLLGHAEGIETLPKGIWTIPANTGLSLIPSMAAEGRRQGVRITVLVSDAEPVLADYQ